MRGYPYPMGGNDGDVLIRDDNPIYESPLDEFLRRLDEVSLLELGNNGERVITPEEMSYIEDTRKPGPIETKEVR